jgi:hypothetical protein
MISSSVHKTTRKYFLMNVFPRQSNNLRRRIYKHEVSIIEIYHWIKNDDEKYASNQIERDWKHELNCVVIHDILIYRLFIKWIRISTSRKKQVSENKQINLITHFSMKSINSFSYKFNITKKQWSFLNWNLILCIQSFFIWCLSWFFDLRDESINENFFRRCHNVNSL